MSVIDADIEVEDEGWRTIPALETTIEHALDAAARGCGLALPPGVAVSVLMTGDGRMRELNRDWRDQDKPTNVLSFAAVPADRLRARPDAAPFLGDVALAWETVAREAANEGKEPAHHLAHLVVHGFLHLVGYDHETDAEAQVMETLETRILAGMGIRDPYDESVHAPKAAGGGA